jgi:hypothetical protein
MTNFGRHLLVDRVAARMTKRSLLGLIWPKGGCASIA